MIRLLPLLGLAILHGIVAALLELELGLPMGAFSVPWALYLAGGVLLLGHEAMDEFGDHWADWPSMFLWPIALPVVAVALVVWALIGTRVRQELRWLASWLQAIASNAGRFIP